MNTTEQRWFRVRGRYIEDRDLKPKTHEFELTVTVTGSYHDMINEMSTILLRDHKFFATGVVSQSKDRDTL